MDNIDIVKKLLDNDVNLKNQVKQLIKLNNTDNWITLKDACKYTNLSQSTLFRAIKENKLKVSKVTGKLLFKKLWLDNFLES
tara:strand:- start:107 stop:352 length:246 start_codon:yes stop_codon:yes gene_type:complete